jgi:hypothetical protein
MALVTLYLVWNRSMMLMLMGKPMLARVILRMPMVMRMFVIMLLSMFVIMRMFVAARMLVRVLRLLLPELFPGQFLLARCNHVHFRRADPAAVHPGDFQPRVHAQRFHRAGEYFRHNSGVNQRAKKHVAADSGEAF